MINLAQGKKEERASEKNKKTRTNWAGKNSKAFV